MKFEYYFFPLGLLSGFFDRPHTCCRKVTHWLVGNDIAKQYGKINEMLIQNVLEDYKKNNKYPPCGFRIAPDRSFKILEVYNQFAQEKNSCFVSLSKKYFTEIYKKGDKLTEWERVVFLGYVALKSIEGRKRTVCKANNSLMFQRMTGNDYNSISDNFKKYSSTYYLNKIRTELQSQFHNVKIYAKHTRGFYFTTRRDISRDKVVYCAFTAKKKYKESRIREKNKESEERVKKSLELENEIEIEIEKKEKVRKKPDPKDRLRVTKPHGGYWDR